MQVIKIMHIAQSAGGVAKYIQMLSKYLNHQKYKTILICSEDYSRDQFKDFVNEIIFIPMTRSINLKKDLFATVSIRKLIKKYQPDIVYAHSSKAGALVRVANIGIKNKCIYNPHGWAFNIQYSSNYKILLYKCIEKVLSPLCDCIVCISNSEKKTALQNNICSESKLNIICNGIDIQKYIENSPKEVTVTRESIGIPENALVVGYVGRISTQKAPDIYIKAAKLIREKSLEAYFIIVGDGEQKSEIINYTKKHNFNDKLIITGWVNDPMPYIQLFDIAVLLSRWEGFGLVLPEYMIAEKPIIATCVDAIPDIIIEEENGLLIVPDAPEKVVEKVELLYKNESLRKKLICNGKKIAITKYDVKRVSKEHEELFEKLTGGN